MLCFLLKKVDINNKKVNKDEREKRSVFSSNCSKAFKRQSF